VAALAGEKHSVVARAAAARADAVGLPFLCSSAVLDALTEQPTEWVLTESLEVPWAVAVVDHLAGRLDITDSSALKRYTERLPTWVPGRSRAHEAARTRW
jgi:hypothetical protein